MNFLTISGSGRKNSTNTALLHELAKVAASGHSITFVDNMAMFPVFTPDLESVALPKSIQQFVNLVRAADGIIISSPEYVRSIQGGLKNAIDWLVSRNEFISKPIILVHASHRGDDMLSQLRMVLSTVSDRFSEEIFYRFELLNKSPEEISKYFIQSDNKQKLEQILKDFGKYCN